MTTSSSTIDSTSTYYRQRVANAENDQRRVERLESLSADRLHKDGGFNLADPARYCRAHGFEDILNNTQPGTYGNWARHYLSALDEPTFYRFDRTLEKLAAQSADADGQHTLQDAALFTTAASQILAAFTLNEPTMTGQNDGLVDLALGLIRSAQPGVHPHHQMETLTRAAFRQAVQDLLHLRQDNNRHQLFTRLHYDDLGRTQYHTAILATLLNASILAETMSLRFRLSPDDPGLKELQHISTTNLHRWTEESVRLCAFDAISSSHLHHMATPLGFSDDVVSHIGNTAQDIIAKHPDISVSKHQWLTSLASNQPWNTLGAAAQHDLSHQLDQLMREYNGWSDHVINFDDYSSPKEENFRELETLHAQQSVLHASIMVAATRITQPAYAPRRDAIMAAAAGTINWQCREEFDTYEKHVGPAAQHRNAVLGRLNTASAIVQAMPAQVIPATQKQTILQHDQRRRSAIDEIIR